MWVDAEQLIQKNNFKFKLKKPGTAGRYYFKTEEGWYLLYKGDKQARMIEDPLPERKNYGRLCAQKAQQTGLSWAAIAAIGPERAEELKKILNQMTYQEVESRAHPLLCGGIQKKKRALQELGVENIELLGQRSTNSIVKEVLNYVGAGYIRCQIRHN